MQYTGPVQFRLFRFDRNADFDYFTKMPLLVGTIPSDEAGRRDLRSIIRILRKELDSLYLRLDYTPEIRGVLYLFGTESMDPRILAENVLSDKIYIRGLDFSAIHDILVRYAIYPYYSAR